MAHNGKHQIKWDRVRGELRALASEGHPDGPFLDKEPTPRYQPDLFHFVGGHTCVGLIEAITDHNGRRVPG